MKRSTITVGQKFGRLTVTDEAQTLRTKRRFVCSCECGSATIVRIDHLNGGKIRSCGCLWKEGASPRKGCVSFNWKHGDRLGENGKPAAEYVSYYRMIDRCENPNNNRFEYYGGRGIKICARWRGSYEIFLADMGRKPSSIHSLDRIDVNGDYEPDNCRWATLVEQARNKQKRTTV